MDSIQALELAKRAIDELGRNPEADNWMVNFELTATAWDIAHQLLAAPNAANFSAYRFFGARILYTKIQRDLSLQLSKENALQLKEVLIQKLLELSKESPVDIKTFRYVCLALSAIAIQLKEEGVVNQLLGSLNELIASAPHLILEFLIVLPEECVDRNLMIDSETQNSFLDQLTQTTSTVLTFLQTLLISSPNSIEMSKKIFDCVRIWIEITDIPAELLVQHSLFVQILSCLQSKSQLEETSEILISCIRKYSDMSYPMSTLRSFFTVIFQPILSQREHWSSNYHGLTIDSDFDDITASKALTRLFTEFAIGLYEDNDIFAGSVSGEEELLQQLLLCTSSSADAEIPTIPLSLFNKIRVIIEERKPINLREKFSSYYRNLLNIAVIQLSQLSSSLTTSGLLETTADPENTRLEWLLAIEDCAFILDGPICLDYVCTQLRTENISLAMVESCLQAIVAISAVYLVPCDEAVYIPWLISLLPSLSQSPSLKKDIFKFIERISHWISVNSSNLISILTILMSGLNEADNCFDSSKTLTTLCKRCARIDSFPFTEIHAQLVHLRSLPGFNFKADLNVIAGLGKIISSQNYDVSCGMLNSLITPIAQSLSANIAAGTQSSKIDFSRDLDRITTIFQSVSIKLPSGSSEVPTPIYSLFIQLWPMVQQLVLNLQSDDIDEKACRLYKHAIRKITKEFTSHVGLMCSHIVEVFQARPSASFVYLVSIIIGEYAHKNSELVPSLRMLFDAIITILLSKFTTLDVYIEFPDVIEEYFFLLGSVISKLPSILYNDAEDIPRLCQIVQSGIVGLAMSHKKAQRGILKFFHTLTSIGNPCSEIRSNESGMVKLDASTVTALNDFIPQYLPALLNEIFANISGRLPPFALLIEDSYDDSGCIGSVVWELLQVTKLIHNQPFEGWITQVIAGLPITVQEDVVRLNIIRLLTFATSVNEVINILIKLDQSVRRRSSRSYS